MLYIVVPTFNRIEIFQNFIKQIKSQNYQDYKLVIVDHGSKKTNYKDSEDIVIESDVNGWSYAINVGIRYVLDNMDTSDDDYIMVINDDVLMENDYLLKTIEAISLKPQACIGSCCFDWNTNKILHVNMILNKKNAAFEYLNRHLELEELSENFYESDVLKGRGTVWPVRVLRDIGIYNEKKLPHYRADHELAWRAKKCGYEVCVSGNMRLGAILDSPNRIDKSKGFIENYNRIFNHMISTENTKDLWNYANCLFNKGYALWFFGLNWLRFHVYFIICYVRR